MMKKVEVWKSTEPEVLEKMPFAQKYEGYVVDLIRALSKQVKFKYNMYIVEDGAYGAQLPNGEWNGMIRDLIDHVRNRKSPFRAFIELLILGRVRCSILSTL